jgi:uncharacterized membrane protein
MHIPHHYKTESTLGKNRVEAFSDGVFAVAVTLLVLNFQSPQFVKVLVEGRNYSQWAGLLPVFLAYLLSFVIVGIYWVAHHNTFHYIRHSDRNLLWLNILLLMCIVFIPFPTALLGQYPERQISIIIYGGTLVITGALLQLLWWYATSHYRLVDKDIDPRLIARATRRNLMAPAVYLLAIALSFLNCFISLAIFAIVPLLYIIPGHIDQHWTTIYKIGEVQEIVAQERSAPVRDPAAEQEKMQEQQKTYKRPGGENISGKAFYQRQIAALEACNTDILLTQYHPDATIISFDFVVKGHEAIRKHFEEYLSHLGALKLKNTEKFAETDDAIFFEATVISNLGEARVYNVFLLQNGKATHHFTGVVSQRQELVT